MRLTAPWDMLRLALRRLINDLSLSLGTLLGLVTVVAIATSVPLYVEAANNDILRQELGEIETGGSPAFAYMYHIPYVSRPVSTAEFHAVDDYLADQAPHVIGLPLDAHRVMMNSERLGLFPASEDSYRSVRNQLGYVQLGFVRDLRAHIEIVEGHWPDESAGQNELAVLVSEALADDLGLSAGEAFRIYRDDPNFGRVDIPLRVAGIWIAADHDDPFWFLPPDVYDQIMLLPEETYLSAILPGEEAWALDYAAWYQAYVGANVTAERVPAILGGMGRTLAVLKGIVPTLSAALSPEWELVRHQEAVRRQNNLLLAFGVPVMALLLLFTAYLSGLSIQHRGQEIALLRSRGASVRQVIGLFIIQGALLGLVALALGLPLGVVIAQLIGRTRAFMQFDLKQPGMAVQITTAGLQVGLAVMLISVASYLLPAVRAARLTAVSFWRRQRLQAAPLWRRLGLDVALALVAAYGVYAIRGGEGLAFLRAGQSGPLQEPIVLLAPSLYLLAGVLLFLRGVPRLLNLLARLVELLPGTTLLLALRQLARNSQRYGGVLMLLALSCGLSLFTASMAKTLDANLVDRAHYQTGGDVAVLEKGWGVVAQDVGLQELMQGEDASLGADEAASLSVVPSDEALRIAGVRAVTRVHRFAVQTISTQPHERGTVLGIDRYTFPTTTYYRDDFSQCSLGSLLNALATQPGAALIDRGTLLRHSLSLGDTVRLQFEDGQAQAQPLVLTLVGTVDLFPGIVEEDKPLFVARSQDLLEALGAPMPGQLWLRVDEGTEEAWLVGELEALDYQVRSSRDARAVVAKEQSGLLRVGLFGLLSVGFVAVALLSVLSLMIYSFMSFQARSIQFGVLQAIGMYRGQLERQFIVEQLLIVAQGVGVGTLLGLLACREFLPAFQVTYAAISPLPPMIVHLAWGDMARVYAMLGLSLLALSLVALRLLHRLRMFEAIKLGSQTTG